LRWQGIGRQRLVVMEDFIEVFGVVCFVHRRWMICDDELLWGPLKTLGFVAGFIEKMT
jgi:hypothetical protein